MKLSIIIPTLGRKSLNRTLDSLKDQRASEDEILVVGDGPQKEARRIVEERGVGYRYLETPPTHRWGHAQRNLGMSQSKGDYLAFMDDDDVYLPGAFEAMRKAASDNPKIGLFLFRMKIQAAGKERIIWDPQAIYLGNVSTQMILLKRTMPFLAQWGPHPLVKSGSGGDYIFIRQNAGILMWDNIRFEEAVIAQLDKHLFGTRDA